MDNFEKILECNEIVKKHLNEFIEIFVSYYGEDKREEIQNKFNDTLFLAYIDDKEYGRILNKIEKKESKKIIDEILKGTNYKKESIFSENIFNNNSPINKYKDYYNEFILGEEKREQKYYENMFQLLKAKTNLITFEEYMVMVKTKEIPQNFKDSDENIKKALLEYSDTSAEKKAYETKKKNAVKFLNSIGVDVNIDNIEEKIPSLEEINNILKKYKEAELTFNQIKDKYKKYYNINEYNKTLKNELENKYYKEYLKSITPLLKGKIKEDIENYLNNNKYIPVETQSIIGRSFLSEGLIDYFSSKQEEKLNDDKVAEWKKTIIKENRIKCFDKFGINLGVLPDIKDIDQMMKIKKKIVNNFNIEYYNNIMPIKEFNEEVKRSNFINLDKTEMPEVFMQNMTCVIPNLKRNENSYYLSAKLLINIKESNIQEIDHFLVHELNHLYELSLLNITDEDYDYISGWDMITEKIDNNKEIELNRPKRKYELFNEIINEKISEDISETAIKKGITIFSDLDEVKYKNTTSYKNTNYLVSDFFEKYKEQIIRSRSNSNIQIIFDTVGEKNFNDLNELFEIHNKYFDGMSYYSLICELKDGKDTEKTKIYYSLKERRDKILNNMDEYYKESIENTKNK